MALRLFLIYVLVLLATPKASLAGSDRSTEEWMSHDRLAARFGCVERMSTHSDAPLFREHLIELNIVPPRAAGYARARALQTRSQRSGHVPVALIVADHKGLLKLGGYETGTHDGLVVDDSDLKRFLEREHIDVRQTQAIEVWIYHPDGTGPDIEEIARLRTAYLLLIQPRLNPGARLDLRLFVVAPHSDSTTAVYKTTIRTDS